MKKIFWTGWVFTLIALMPAVNAAFIPNQFSIDTIAGYATTLTSPQLKAGINLNFQIQKPNGGVLNLPARTGTDGKARINLDGYHTTKSGLYQVNWNLSGEKPSFLTRFTVYPDIFSPVQSKVSLNNYNLALNQTLTGRIQVKDRYGNLIRGQLMQVISSRPEDTIKLENGGLSDQNGQVVFTVKSAKTGVSVFTILNQNTNQAMQERAKAVFTSADLPRNIGGNIFSADLTGNIANTDSFGILDHFELSFPDQVRVNDDQNYLKIMAKDKNNNTVRSYLGTVIIEVEGDDNAAIPNNGQYTFIAQDQGEKAFSLALTFTSEGGKKIRVYDYDNGKINKNLSGEKVVKVVEKLDNTDLTDQSAIQIKSPVNEQVYGSSTITISGLAAPNTNLKLMLDEAKIDDLAVDMEGFFSKTLQNISDGSHSVYVMEAEGARRASPPVQFSVDATPPIIDKLELNPQTDLKAGDNYQIIVYSESKLDKAEARVAGVNQILKESATMPGKYEAALIAPDKIGDYSLDIVLTDELGNAGNYRQQAMLKVTKLAEAKISEPQNMKIENNKITWEAPAKGDPTLYRLYAGSSQYNMGLVGQTNKLFTFLNNAKVGENYYIALSAMNSDGEESEMTPPQ
ncbi:MAG TPA: hypothetical protein PLQ36_01540, partial [Candidatus Gracilibacteria bacterium]|nr:hypothetical protein [Candidatus Gracilibacteria bacterium]